MYFGSSKKQEAAKAAFQQERSLETGELLYQDTPDILIGLIRIMGTGLTLRQASVVIIMEPMYNPNLFLQVLSWPVNPKRQREGQPHLTIVREHLHSPVFWTEDVDVMAPPACMIDIWEATQSGAPAFSIEPDGEIAIDDHLMLPFYSQARSAHE